MDKIILIDPVQDPRWDRFVENHPAGWVCHLSDWKQALESSFRQMKGYYFVLLDKTGEHIEAGLPVFHVKSCILGDRLVSIPFATLCDPLVSHPSQFRLLFSSVQALSQSLNCKWIEIRSTHAGSHIQGCDLAESNGFKHHYLELKQQPEDLWRQFHRKAVRYAVRKAQKNGIKIRRGYDTPDASCVDEFFRLYRKTRRRLGLPLQPFRFFQSLWHFLSPQGRVQILIAEKDRTVVGGLLVLKFKERVSAEYISYDPNLRKLYPSQLLFWEAIQMASREGFGVFDFGRTAHHYQGLMKFKDRWATKAVSLPQFFYPPNAVHSVPQDRGSLKQRLLSAVCQHAPDFAQTAIGEFCYRHLG
jgi:CelD/BcsL family acetyltransferase involved in cellulose biosynthesis